MKKNQLTEIVKFILICLGTNTLLRGSKILFEVGNEMRVRDGGVVRTGVSLV